ncbi:HAMP domain-containing histidine kinase [Streptomyces sp. NBC_00201]|uniref:sensor histidine kinase n=1 Tax=unclassified Streptomyces TaxID=2593676 RepID=UPI002256C7DC|nr:MULTISPECIES: HAMP domain-containing sensor histidine kinase [unclassified Streptomyces]MCX5058426.1 HAMP domain-containing histidine kinase [Streptomyces sp. NBC_00452]MCX5244694.1 HAMP domain-containing histidine kinase [Streptomyces sp. NBC_00201]MCX5289574.1 HAMP domain-containing histidine kinase [Streptomyces sp. NBC_00183]
MRLVRHLPRPRTLRARLTVGLVVLLAVSCAAVGVAAVIELNGFLISRLDQQLTQAGDRFPESLEHKGRPPDDHDGDEHGDTRRQTTGTFGARLVGATVTNADVVGPGSVTDVPLSARDREQLLAVPADGKGHGIDLSTLDAYRVVAGRGKDGDVLITGLPLEPVEATVHRLELVAGIVFGAALTLTGVAGALWVRWSLRPLSRVAATATRVSELSLASGEVALPPRAPETDPRSEVGRVAGAFNRMLGHVEDALTKRHASEERLRSFAADASHELRTPVASVRGHAELALLHPGPVPPEVTRALERIAAESGRMGAMVDDLLLLARLDAGRPLERRPVDLTRLVLDAVTDARAAGPGHRWTLDLPEEPLTVTGDEHRLHQVLANLLANARVHTPAGTKVTVALETDDSFALLTVHDDGPGVPEDIESGVFERFTRAEHRRRTDAPGGGAGLGLSIVAAVVEAHGGRVALHSTPGSTQFTVRLPARGARG